MIAFHLHPAYVSIEDSYILDQSLFAKTFPLYASWLEANEIGYRVFGFRWPEMLSLMAGNRAIVVEFELQIEDADQAIMFRLYSGVGAHDT